MKVIVAAVAAIALLSLSSAHADVKSVVLVHGAFADGSGWKPLAEKLMDDGYSVHVVQIPETSFAADVAATRRVLEQAGPSVLVGHSYAGMVITEVGGDSNARSLVYVAAFEPDVGETAGQLNSNPPPAASSVVPAGDGFLVVKPESFQADVAADVPADVARFMSVSQVPIAQDAFSAKVTVAPWKTKPSFAVVAKQDRMINPDLERTMAKRAGSEMHELPGSHVLFVTHAAEIAAIVEKAAKAGGA
jgi:pimeloyl-ACP methyl ester carboxylesterase